MSAVEIARRMMDDHYAAQAEPMPATATPAEPEEGSRESQASMLVKFVTERGELFHDQNRGGFARIAGTGRNFRLDGRAFRDWLSAAFFEAEGKSPRDQSIREAIGTLSGLARHRGDQHEVFLRVGMAGGAYYIDLCEPDTARAIELRPGAWSIVDSPPVRFARTEAMQPLPAPAGAGSLDALWSLTNIPEPMRVLVASWLVESLRPDTPFPVLELLGEAGSAKSTTHTALKRLIDPNACDLRAPPKATEDCFVTAGVNWVVSYENVSHLPAPMQDALCVLATGGGFAKRKLYSDGEEAVINVKRPVILNGISANITAHDLADRAITIELPVIQNRVAASYITRSYERNQSEIMAGLLAVAAEALRRLPEVRVPPEERPRMLEFFTLGVAVGDVMGSDFRAAFNATRSDAASRAIDGSPVAAALVEWFNARHQRSVQMSAKDLMRSVEQHRPEHAEAWPKSPRGFGDALRRAASSLRFVGIEVRSMGNIGGHVQWQVSARKVSEQRHECHEHHANEPGSMTSMTSMTSDEKFSRDEVLV